VNVGLWLLWGFVATLVLTTLLAASQWLRLTRMNLPFILGTMLTNDRERAKVYGFVVHALNGWVFALVYIACFHALGRANVLLGMLGGLVHAGFVLFVGIMLLPALHPRMASETRGPEIVPMLEPPGFLALHYGVRTPISVVLAHLVYGGLLGGLYHA
jgi:hypothetical protein